MKNRTFTIKNDPEDKQTKIYTFKHIKVLIPTDLAKDYVKFVMEYHGTVNFKTYPLYYDLTTFESESKILDNHCSNYANFEYNIPYDERIFNIINDEITRFNKEIEENGYDFTLAETDVILPRKG